MKIFIKKVLHLFYKNRIDQKSELTTREIENSKLRDEKKSDINRWQNNEELFLDWNERTIILGSYVLPGSKIVEFGAGNMILKTHLKNYISYTPSDIVKRFEETLVCDLNQPISFSMKSFDVVIFSGVLEYVYDIDRVFTELGLTIKQVVLSYCCSDIVKLSRDKNGWLSDYTKNDLEQIFANQGFKIENYSEWRNQSLYNLIRK